LKSPQRCQREIAAWVEDLVEKYGADSQFCKLIENGCDRESLFQLLAAVALTWQIDTWETFAGLHAQSAG
jgi:hypothetical protein